MAGSIVAALATAVIPPSYARQPARSGSLDRPVPYGRAQIAAIETRVRLKAALHRFGLRVARFVLPESAGPAADSLYCAVRLGRGPRSFSRYLDLVEQYGPVDFLKVDIEGAEQEVLTKNTGRASAVSTIQVEIHEPYTVEHIPGIRCR